MKILHVTASIDSKKGGVSQAIRTIIGGLEEKGVLNSVVCLDRQEEMLSENPQNVTALGAKKNPWNYSASLVPWLKEHLENYEVVIVHGLWLYHGFAVNKVIQQQKRSNRIKLFVMPHGMLDPYFQRAGGRKIKAIRNAFYWHLIERNVVNSADGLLFTCEEERKLASQTFKRYYPKQQMVVGLGVEEPPVFTERMKLALWGKCPEVRDHPFLLFLSRIHEKKGVDILIEAYKFVFESVSTYRHIPKLIIAGPGIETTYGRQIQRVILNDPFLSANVYFPGMLSGDAKWGAFYGSEAFVLPSHQENFGIAVVEALACGKPVMISDQVNIWREIKTSSGGIIATDTRGGTEELLSTWNSLADTERKQMSLSARKCYEEYFCISLTSEKLVESLSLD
jgi:glycosyltransferase involved in cell wall biosynthesis